MRVWDSNSISTAFASENRRGRDPVAVKISAELPSLIDLPIAAAAGSSNFQLTVPVLSLSGRGLNVRLDLTYNSRLWHPWSDEDGGHISYDIDGSWPAAGWSFGFGKTVLVETGQVVYDGMLVDSDGTRHPYIRVGQKTHGSPPNESQETFYHTTDGTFIEYSNVQSSIRQVEWAQAIYADGTIVFYGAHGHGWPDTFTPDLYPTSITDANGNSMTIAYRNRMGPEIETVTDTLGRVVEFHYDNNDLLTAVTGPGLDGSTRTAVRLHYRKFPLDFFHMSRFGFRSPAVVPDLDENPWLIDGIYYPGTKTGYWFGDADSYSGYGMLAKISQHRGMGFAAASLTEQGTVTAGELTRQQVYDYPLKATQHLTDAPTYTTMVETWADMDTPPAMTTFGVRQADTSRQIEVTHPDGRRTIEFAYNHPGQFDDGLFFRHEVHDAAPDPLSGRLLQQVSMAWEPGDYGSARLTRIELSDELGETTATEYSYGVTHNLVTELREYDYGGVNLLRTVRTQYDQSAIDAGIFGLPAVVEVYAPGEPDPLTRTEYSYDTTQVLDAPGVVSHADASALTGIPSRHPNLVTQIKSYADAAHRANPVTETRRYDITGNLRTAEISGSVLSYTFSPVTQYAYPSEAIVGASDPTSSDRVMTRATYDFNTGLPTSLTDANGLTTQLVYEADSLRLRKVLLPTGASGDYEYDDAAMTFSVTLRTVTGDVAYQQLRRYDGQGSSRYIQELSGTTRQDVVFDERGRPHFEQVPLWNVVAIRYDEMGRLQGQTQPFQAGRDELWKASTWTEVSYDALDRVTEVLGPDSSRISLFHNEANRPSVFALPGRTVRVVDAWGRERWTLTDALGRLIVEVDPDPGGNGSVFDASAAATFYNRDVLDRVVRVGQYPGPQNRMFRYDSLGRLTHQYMPEKGSRLNDAGHYGGIGTRWSDVFTYDERSNITSHTDSRGVRTLYHYDDDPLSRLQFVTYDVSGAEDVSSPIRRTAAVTYNYMDSGDVRRFASISTEGVCTIEYAYDSQGRLRAKTQTMADAAGQFPLTLNFRYDTLNRLADIRYPVEYGTAGEPRRLIHRSYDGAGRLSALTVDGSDYVSDTHYDAFGHASSLHVGAKGPLQVVEDYTYDPLTGLLQGQRVLRAGIPLLDLAYDYLRPSPSPAGRTGQLTHLVDLLNEQGTRSYEYDALSRLTRVAGGQAGPKRPGPAWSQTYTYDRFGNRLTVTTSADRHDTTIPSDGLPSVDYDNKTNRITTAGFAYDQAGNQAQTTMADGTERRYHYDAAGRLTQVLDHQSNLIEEYTYGSDNRRLMTRNGATGDRTYHVWHGGVVVAEYSADASKDGGPSWAKNLIYIGGRLLATQWAEGAVQYHHPDRIGTRLTTNAGAETVTGQVTLPFGIALDAESTGSISQRFTTFDRDTGVGLDYAVNRHYAFDQGRFTQVDPLGMAAVDPLRPQSLNMFAYVGNDPVNSTDPLGLRWILFGPVWVDTGGGSVTPIVINGMQGVEITTEGHWEPASWVEVSDRETPEREGRGDPATGLGRPGPGSLAAASGTSQTGRKPIPITIGGSPRSQHLLEPQPSSWVAGIGLSGSAQINVGVELGVYFVFDSSGGIGLLIAPGGRIGPDINVGGGLSGFVYGGRETTIADLTGPGLSAGVEGGDVIDVSVFGLLVRHASEDYGSEPIFGFGATGGLGAGIGAYLGLSYGFIPFSNR
jgi:RHS repeat-associated protein